MMWENATLDAIKAPEKGALVSGPFGSNIGSRFFVNEGVPLIRGNNLSLGREKFIDDGFVFITEEKARELKNCIAKYDDILFTAAGTLGQVALVPKVSRFPEYIISNKQIRIRLNTKKVFPLFVYYFLSSPSMRAFIASQNKGSSVPLLTLGIIRKLTVPVPPLNVQRKIAAILSAYDELIETNRRRIALLEKLAEEIYREWFVRLRFPGHENVKLVKGVPSGWKVKKLSELVRTQYGYTTSADAEGPGPKFLRITDIVPAAIDWESVPHCKIDDILEEKYLLHEGDIVVARTGATVGYAKRINRLHPKAVFASYLVRLIPNRKMDAVFLGMSVERNAFKDFIMMYVTGAAQPQANATTMALFPVLYPPESVLIDFNQIAQPILDQKEILLNQMAMLARARDLLLPRLISGKLSVEDLDIQFPPGMQSDSEL